MVESTASPQQPFERGTSLKHPLWFLIKSISYSVRLQRVNMVMNQIMQWMLPDHQAVVYPWPVWDYERNQDKDQLLFFHHLHHCASPSWILWLVKISDYDLMFNIVVIFYANFAWVSFNKFLSLLYLQEMMSILCSRLEEGTRLIKYTNRTIHSFIHSFIPSFIHSFIHSFIFIDLKIIYPSR